MGQTTGEWITADLGILGAGGVSVGVYSTLHPAQIAYLLADCKATLVFVGSRAELKTMREAVAQTALKPRIVGWGDAEGTPDTLGLRELTSRGTLLLAQKPERLAELRNCRSWDDLALLIYTSGTTGTPKGAMLSHGNILSMLEAVGPLLPTDLSGNDIAVSFLPMAHVAEHVVGFYGRINAGYGARYVGSLESQAVLGALTETRPTLFGSVPRIFEKAYAKIRARVAESNPRRQAIFAWAEATGRAMSRHILTGTRPPLSLRLSHRLADRLVLSKIRNAFGGRVKYFVSGAAPIDPDILEFFHACGMIVVEAYGMTELSGIATINRPARPRFGTVGQAIPGFEIKIADDGEILVRGRAVFKGYLNKPKESAEALDAEGWLHTGDIGELDREGFLRITDRKRNLIVTSGGKKVAPAPIEALLTGETLLGPTLIIGESRSYISALLTLDLEEAREVTGARTAGAAELARHPEVRKRAAAAVAKANSHLARFEQIRRFRILDQELILGSEELTPTMKLRRQAVSAKFKVEIDSLYAAELAEGVFAAAGSEGHTNAAA